MVKRKRLRLAADDDRPHTKNVCSFLDKKPQSAQASMRHFFEAKTLPHRRSRNPLTKVVSRTNNSKVQQMHLDLGQQMHKECSICGMFYSLGTEDEKSHRQFCQEYQNGVAISKNSKIIPYRKCSQDDSILCIRPSDKSPSLRKKLATVTRIVHAELGFCPDDDNDDNTATSSSSVFFTNYLFIRNSRIIGIVQTEPIVQAYTLLSPTERSRQPILSPTVGVHLLWVHERHRRTGIARQLMDAATHRTTTVAFSSPSQAGIAFAQHYGRPVLVYDCGGRRRRRANSKCSVEST